MILLAFFCINVSFGKAHHASKSVIPAVIPAFEKRRDGKLLPRVWKLFWRESG